MYRSAIDAFRAVVRGGRAGKTRTRITRVTEKPVLMSNGLEYCFVEVTLASGDQYGIEAFGEEATELRKEATYLRDSEYCMIPLILAA
jgi:hypothetical protein